MTSWGLVDLTAVEVVQQKTTLLTRVDGYALIYPGLVHWFHGESESGKTWLMLIAAAEALNDDRRVVYIDFEDHAGPIVARLQALGIERGLINDPTKFGYIRPDEPVGGGTEPWADLYAGLHLAPSDLAVMDGVTESMELEDLDGNSNRDIAQWIRLLPRTVAADTGASVGCLDHVTKTKEGRGGYAIGGQHKKAGVDGASYEVETIKPFAPVTIGTDPNRGILAVRIRKDRPGYVRSVSPGDTAATVNLTAWPDGGVTWELTTDEVAADHAFRYTIADLLWAAPGSIKTTIRNLGNHALVDTALVGMLKDGHLRIEPGKGNALLHYLTEAGEVAFPRRNGP